MHADIPHQEVIFLDEVDPISSPMKAKGVGELGLCGVARRSPMRSTTRPGSACAIIRSPRQAHRRVPGNGLIHCVL